MKTECLVRNQSIISGEQEVWGELQLPEGAYETREAGRNTGILSIGGWPVFPQEHPYWDFDGTVLVPSTSNFKIIIKGFSEGKERQDIFGTGDYVGATIFRLPEAYTMVVLYGQDSLSPADEAAGLDIWRPWVEKHRGALDEAAMEMGVQKEIPWEYADIAGASLAHGFTSSREFDTWSRQTAVRLESFFYFYQTSGRTPQGRDVSTLKEIVNDVVRSLYFARSYSFSKFVSSLPAKTKEDLDQNFFCWYLNGPTAHSVLLIPEMHLKHELFVCKFPYIHGYFQAAADMTNLMWEDGKHGKHEIVLNTMAADNNRYIDHILRIIKQHVSSQEYHAFLLEKAAIGGFSVLSPDLSIIQRVPLIQQPQVLARSVGITEICSASEQASIAIASDGTFYNTRDLNREMTLESGVPAAIISLVNESPLACRQFLNKNGFTTDDRAAITAEVSWNIRKN